MSSKPEDNLTPAELEDRDRLETVAQRGVETYLEVANALTEIREKRLYRDTHASYEAYLQDRWGISGSNRDRSPKITVRPDAPSTPAPDRHPLSPVGSKPCEALTRACEQTLSALGVQGLVELEVRLAVRTPGDAATIEQRQNMASWPIADLVGDELLPRLRWLLTQASGTIADVAQQLESNTVDLGDGARAQLQDDVLVVDEELAVVKALVGGPFDWDSELKRLLDGEIPRQDTKGNPEDDE